MNAIREKLQISPTCCNEQDFHYWDHKNVRPRGKCEHEDELVSLPVSHM